MEKSHFGTVHVKPIWLKAAKRLEDYPEKFAVSFIFTALNVTFIIVKLRKSKWKGIKGIITIP